MIGAGYACSHHECSDGTLPKLEERNNRHCCSIALHARKVIGSLRQVVVPGNHNAHGKMLIDVTTKQDVIVETQICKICYTCL